MEKTIKIWDKEKKSFVKIDYLRTITIENWNYDMGKVWYDSQVYIPLHVGALDTPKKIVVVKFTLGIICGCNKRIFTLSQQF